MELADILDSRNRPHGLCTKLEKVMTAGSTVELVKLRKSYGSTVAVDGIDLRIAAGAYCCLLGPSGCGKTSTLRMIAGHEDISDGDLLIGDKVMNGEPPARRGTAMTKEAARRSAQDPSLRAKKSRAGRVRRKPLNTLRGRVHPL